MNLFATSEIRGLDTVQRFSLTMMAGLMLLTFVGTNLQALLWQSSDWLVSTVLPAVVIDLTNDERDDNSVTPLRRNSVLDAAAQAKAEHMAKHEYFAHYAPDGTTPWTFFKAEGYVYAHAGENLAIHFTDSSQVVEAWMLSPAHRKNIVDAKFTEIGVGTAKGTFEGYDTVYVVQLFGTPAVANTTSTPVPRPTTVVTTPSPEAATLAVAEPKPIAAPVVITQSEVDPPADTLVTPVVKEAPEASVVLLDKPEQASAYQSPILAPGEFLETEAIQQASEFNDVMVIQTQLATSSGLAIATLVEPSPVHAGATIASVATRPNLVLDGVYAILFAIVLMSLIAALVVEARRMHFVQVAYSIALLIAMGGLWYAHTTLTGGAIIA